MSGVKSLTNYTQSKIYTFSIVHWEKIVLNFLQEFSLLKRNGIIKHKFSGMKKKSVIKNKLMLGNCGLQF